MSDYAKAEIIRAKACIREGIPLTCTWNTIEAHKILREKIAKRFRVSDIHAMNLKAYALEQTKGIINEPKIFRIIGDILKQKAVKNEPNELFR